MQWLITVKRMVPIRELDPDDRKDRPWGSYVVEADDEEAALDKFHEHIGIACLDDFDILCQVIGVREPKHARRL